MITVTPKILSQLAEQSADWLAYYGGRESFQDLLVHLVLGCPTGGPTLLALLLDCAAPPSFKFLPTTAEELTVQSNAQEFLGVFHYELQKYLLKFQDFILNFLFF